MHNNRELFQIALGVREPWHVSGIEFDVDKRRLDIFVDFGRGTRFSCPEPECDRKECSVHDTADKTWRHLDFFQYRAYLHARVPRVVCPEHGTRQFEVPWSRPGSGFSLLFEALLMELMAEMPVKAVSRLVGEHDTRLWRVLHHYVEAARSKRSDKKVENVGIDETSARRGHDYISLFVDLDVPRLLYATEGRDATTVGAFAADLTAHCGNPKAVKEVACDMSQAFISGIAEHLPKAEITFDRYHLIALAQKAVDETRRAEVKERPELKGTRYSWLKRPENRTETQHGQIEYLTSRSLALKTARAYSWKLAFDDFFNCHPDYAEEYLTRWHKGAVRSRLESIVSFARTVKDHWDGVLRWHKTQISTGVLEGINSLIQATKRRARGYRTKRNLIVMAYLIAGKLDALPSRV